MSDRVYVSVKILASVEQQGDIVRLEVTNGVGRVTRSFRIPKHCGSESHHALRMLATNLNKALTNMPEKEDLPGIVEIDSAPAKSWWKFWR